MQKSTNNKKSSKKQFKLDWKILVAAISLVVLVGIGIGVAAAVKKSKAKVLDVAFYNLPSEISDAIKIEIEKAYAGKKKYAVLEKSLLDEEKIARKYDLFFAWKGATSDSLLKFSKLLPPGCGAEMPESIFADSKTSVPLLLDHFQISYNDTIRHKARIRYPENMNHLNIYLDWIKDYVKYPFYAAGGNDEILYALTSCFIESYVGASGYADFVEKVDSVSDLKSLIDVEFKAKDGSSCTLREVLDVLREWQADGLLPENWLAAQDNDVKNFLEDNLIGVMFTSLSRFRKLPHTSATQFAVDRFPVFNTGVSHGILAPSLVCLNLSDSNRFDDVIYALVSETVQTDLSMNTGFAPVSRTARSYDIQADDVRFLSAACAGGPKTDVGNALFKIEDKKYKDLINQIRFYLKTGIV